MNSQPQPPNFFYGLLVDVIIGLGELLLVSTGLAAYRVHHGVCKTLFAAEAVLQVLKEAPNLKVGPYAFYMLKNKSVEETIQQDYSSVRPAVGNADAFFLAFGGTWLLIDALRRLKHLLDYVFGNAGGTQKVDNLSDVAETQNLEIQLLCVICQERPRNVVFLNCRHFSACEFCSEELTTERCPICRQNVVSSLKVFVS